MNTDVHFSSKSNEWATPQATFDELNREFGFTLDAAATPENAKCGRYFTQEDNALLQDWGKEIVFLNPPYSRQLCGPFIRKAYEASLSGATVVLIIPARTDTRAWHEFIFPFAEIRFLKGRLYFGDGLGRAPFPSAVVIFRPSDKVAPRADHTLGGLFAEATQTP